MSKDNQGIVVAISGYARTGKDTLAKSILAAVPKDIGVNRINTSFAYRVKKAVAEMLESQGLDGKIAFSEDEQDKKIVRPLLVAYGEYRRALNPIHWAHIVGSSIKRKAFIGANKAIVCVPDMRYANELLVLKHMLEPIGFKVIHVHMRRGSDHKPANEAEAKSIQGLLDTGLPDFIFNPGEGNFSAIGEYGGKFAYNCLLSLGKELTIETNNNA